MAAADEALLSRRSWSSDLPVELLFGIFQKLTDCNDISQCAAVCLSWRSVIRNFYRQLKSLQSPFLLLESSSASYLARSRCSCTLFNPQTHERHEIFLPQLKESTSTWSSYDGWLLVLPFSMLKNLCLLNPFTRDRIKLPPHLIEFDSDNCPDMIRVLASTSPLDPECVFFLFENGNLFICRPGDKCWTKVVINNTSHKHYRRCGDTICFKGEFYAEYECRIYHIKLNGSGVAEAIKLPVPYIAYGSASDNYLVELNGELLLVQTLTDHRILENCSSASASDVHVFRLDWHRKLWIEVKNIGPAAILLRNHGSTTLDVTNFGGYFKPNCIYYVDGYKQEVVVYNLETNHSETLPQFSSYWGNTLPDWLRVESAKIMASENDQIDYVAPWPIIEEHFVKVLHKVAEKGLLTLTWAEERAWATIDDNIFEEFGKRYTVSKLKSKYDHFRTLHHEFSKLLAHSGMVWDPKTNIVRADEEVWESYVKKHPFGKRFKSKGFEYYHLVDEIIAYTQSSQFYNTKIGLKIRGVADAANVFFEIKGGKTSTFPGGNEEFRRQEHHPSIEECIKILEAMDDLDDNVHVKAREKFISIDWRRMFVAMSEAKKRNWLYSLTCKSPRWRY